MDELDFEIDNLSFPPVDNSVFQRLDVKPDALTDLARRMSLRLLPYVLPTSSQDLKNGMETRYLRLLHLALLGCSPVHFLSDQLIASIERERDYFENQSTVRQPRLENGAPNPSWLAELAIETSARILMAWALVAARQWESAQLSLGYNRIEKLYNSAPTDISEGHEELFSTLLENVGRDANAATRGEELWARKLFDHHELNSAVEVFWSEFESFSEVNKQWSFWRDWYQGFLDGKPLDWELQRRVALIPDDDWEQGSAHISEKIEEIKATFLSEKAPLAERVVFNDDTAKFHAVPTEISKPDLLGATLIQVEDALDDALADQTNGLHDGSREIRVLRRTLTRYANDPQRIEMDFVSVAIGLRRQLNETEELPKTEENQALRAAVEEGALGIRATHPEVARNREILAQQSLRELPDADKAELAAALPILAAITEGQTADGFADDIPTLINDAIGPPPMGAPPIGAADAATRVFSRASQMSILMHKSAEITDLIHNSPAYKALGIVARGAKVTGWLSILVGIGLRIFGVI